MLYIALSLVVLLLGLLSVFEWHKSRKLSAAALQRLHKRVSEHLSLHEYEAAARLVEKLRRKAPSDPTTQLLYIQQLRKSKRLDEALAVIEEALNADHTSLLVLREKGKILLTQGSNLEALSVLRKCRAVLHSEEDRLYLARAYYRCGEVESAWNAICDLVSGSENGKLLALAGDCCFSRESYEEALRFYSRASSFEQNNTQLLFRTGHCLRRLGHYREAEECFLAILQRDSRNISATLSLGACLEAQGLYTKALLVYQHGQAWELSDPRVLRQAGICAIHTERFEFGELYLKQAMELGGATPQLMGFLGYALERQAKWEEAQSVYLELTRRYPRHPAGYRGIAWLYGVGLSSAISADLARHMAQKSIEISSDKVSWEMLSAVEARSGNFTQAHHIQECLSQQEADEQTAMRHKRAMRELRAGRPLDETFVSHTLVA
ncbi:MAG: tetratricopeptide repeat protein [Verrucomicrobia bacterium]|nr:tetratricopeptide repeat protein [Verrucomicrobiota bacterium]